MHINFEGLLFPVEWLKAALVTALISVWTLIALFAYLNRHSRQPYFKLWALAWMFYSVFLAACIGLQDSADSGVLMMTRRAAIGISALCMCWGTLHLANPARSLREFGLGIALVVFWAYMATYRVAAHFWMVFLVFLLLAVACVHAGVAYYRHGDGRRGASIMSAGLIFWGAHLLVFPLAEHSPALSAAGHLSSTVLAVFLIVSMVIDQEGLVAERLYRDLLGSVADGVFLLGRSSRLIVEVNVAAEQLSGRPRDALIGQPLTAVCPDIDLRSVPEPEPRPSQPRECHVQLPNGGPVTCEYTAGYLVCPLGPVLRSCPARRLGAGPAGGTVAAGPEDGGRRPPGRRCGSRFQQHPHRDRWSQRAVAAAQQ